MTVLAAEPTRARYPDEEGYVERDGVRVFWERYGDGEATVFLLPSWSFLPSRLWKAQIPYLARHFRVVVADGRGAGRSDRPTNRDAYAEQVLAQDVLTVMDASGTDRAVLVSESIGIQRALIVAADRPDRVLGIAAINPYLPLPLQTVEVLQRHTFERRGAALIAELVVGCATLLAQRPRAVFRRGTWRLPRRGGILRAVRLWNRHGLRTRWPEFSKWVSVVDFPEPHSTRQIECGTNWRLEADPEGFIAQWTAERIADEPAARSLCQRVECPLLVIQGAEDAFHPREVAERFVELTAARLVVIPGSGSGPYARQPVPVNLELRGFVESCVSREPARAVERSAR